MGSYFNGRFTVVTDDEERIPLQALERAEKPLINMNDNLSDFNRYDSVSQQLMVAPNTISGLTVGMDQVSGNMLKAVQTRAMNADIEIQKQLLVERNKTIEAGRRQKQKSDIATDREFQHRRVTIGNNGYIELTVERFGSDRKGKLNFKIVQNPVIYFCRGEVGEILYGRFKIEDKAEGNLFLDLSNLKPCKISRRLDGIGIRFGFGSRKELECRQDLIVELIVHASRQELPLHHGWKREAGAWDYCYPEDLTWEEVIRYV